MIFRKYERFKKRVGLIDSLEELAQIGAPVPEHEFGMYETDKSQRDALNSFLTANPNYHIATVIDSETHFIIENRGCLVNRSGFYLCNGDKDITLILEEPEEVELFSVEGLTVTN